ncbi:MAG: peroxiredoxin [Alphaproteobacteria bacterium]|nr:peroxiredoxin [Alphaproteobacteria bacterium]
MAIKEGDKVPSVTLQQMTAEGPKPISTDELFKGKRVVVIGVPGAFTPTCSTKHLPGFVDNLDAIKAKGVDTIACVSVNDAFVMDSWGKAQNADGKVLMLGDGNADFTKALGFEWDVSKFGMGVRSRRFAMLVEDGVVKNLLLEEGTGLDVSTAENLLGAL